MTDEGKSGRVYFCLRLCHMIITSSQRRTFSLKSQNKICRQLKKYYVKRKPNHTVMQTVKIISHKK